jgi:hypothetical protein
MTGFNPRPPKGGQNPTIFSPPSGGWGVKYYCIKGITNGYLKSSPFAALTLAIMIQITLRVTSIIIIGIPIIMKHKGIARTIYNSIDNWKFREFLPFRFTQADSSFFDNQHISGPIIPPKGKKKLAKADK